MLAKAVQKHDAGPSRKAQTLSQQLFPSSSPVAGKDKLRGVSQRSVAPANVLKPSSSFSHNTSNTQGKLGNGNPLKRTASQANESSMGSSWSRQSTVNWSQSTPDTGFSQAINDAGRVGKLHETVFFDENDFVDDADIDLDEEDNYLKGQLPLPEIKPDTTPLYPILPTLKPKAELSSDANVPWSSSPLHHKAAQPNVKAEYRSVINSTDDLKELPVKQELAGESRTQSKRRTLPWLDADSREVTTARNGPPPHVQKMIDRQKKNRDRGMSDAKGDSYTPLPKDEPKSPYLWEKTASAVKEEQKKLRQANKKMIKTVEGGNRAALALQKTVEERYSVAKVFLSDEQKKVLNLVTEVKKSVFFTGSAGTGKSVLLREIIKTLRKKWQREPDRVAVTASTGLAACNVGGVTLHSFGGIGLGKEAVPELVKKIKRNQKAKNRWMRTKVLVIDEISMVDGDLFDKLEGIARIIRNNGRPFGGIQLVITGDFFQLPPVPDSGRLAKFAFDAATWNTSIEHTIGLTQVFRQKDPVFANMLNEMRLGKLSQKSISTFRTLSRPLSFEDSIEATELFPTRLEVENANGLRMKNLGGTAMDFRATDGGSIIDQAQREKLLLNCMAPPLITIKKGAQVMLIKNIDETLVNGSLGKVIAFMDEKNFDIYHENEDEFQAVETMDSSDENMTQSRKKLKALINKDHVSSTGQKWPLVRFHLSDGTTRDLLCQHESWKIELPNGEVQASRSQVPLILAWALSIHKAQGQTLERVKVDLGRIFEKGQAYVALSRATCQDGLQILRFDPKKVMAHDKVRHFYDSLYSIDQARKPAVGLGDPKPTNGTARTWSQKGGPFEDDEDALLQMHA